MIEHEDGPPAAARPARDHRTAETVMKTVLIVAAIAGALVLLPMVFFIAVFAMAN
ncbi:MULTISPECIES: hypothetical protein [unclassified Streptomyces]|uniref:hypothetical protein n=1 Tax=unclassified Streptomyces TaxID=2593676 RepID=UPI00136A5892|nr:MULTISPECIES: hypothetical protein [unclassified Streptomyces]MYT18556.1 hypothetical protein [Streptomyces sp. SID4951]